MKRIKWTPVLLLFPISIIIFIIDMRSEAWTPFSLFFIIGFILMMCLLLLIDRFFIIWFKQKSVWIVEIVLIILVLIYVFKESILNTNDSLVKNTI